MKFILVTLASAFTMASFGSCQGELASLAKEKTTQESSSQQPKFTPPVNAKALKLSWKVLEEGYQGKNQTLSVLTIENTGKTDFPATGWQVYFHCSPSFKSAAAKAPLKTTPVNGDLLRMEPTASFDGIPAGGSLSVEFTSAGQIINESRAPNGFYIVWSGNQSQGYALENYTIAKPSNSGVEWETPLDIFRQNETIQDLPAASLTKIFPTPAHYLETGAVFTLTSATPIVTHEAFRKEATLLAGHLGKIFGQQPAVQAQGSGKVIRLQQKSGLGPEAYELKVNAQEIVIYANTPAGAFYGTQSLQTLLPASALASKPSSVSVPGVAIEDAPRFGHRAFMMDVVRNFQKKEQVLKVLDLMALYKLNVLHFHFSDDEAWRIEIPGLPELTEVGSRRGHTLDEQDMLIPALGSGPDADKSSGSGHYSKADYIDILKYATARHIKVIPEVETPGHARAAVKSMDARYNRLMKQGKKAEAEQYVLRDLKDSSKYRSVQYFNDNVMDVSLPSTYAFLQKVTDELLAMYQEAGAPIQTIHFGGDEVPAGVWEKSPSVQALIAQNPKVKNTDDLWYYFFGKVNDMLKKRNLYLSGWEEIGLKKVRQNGRLTYMPNPDFANENFHIDVWNNQGSNLDLAYRMANAGYKIVLTNVSNLYMDLAYQKVYEENGLYWGGYLDVDKPFQFIPYNYMKNMRLNSENKPYAADAFKGKEQLKPSARKNIIGLQAPLWSEKVKTPERLEYMLLPKLLGLAERAWAPDPAWATEANSAKSTAGYNQAWSGFVNVLGKRELPRLSYYAGGFQYRIPTVGAKVENGKVKANVQLPGFTIRYTTNGTEPTAQSKTYTAPVAEKGTVMFKVFDAAGRGGRAISVENK